MADIVVEPLTDRDGFLARWTALFDRAANATFFLSPAWMCAWLEGAPPWAELFALETGGSDAPAMMAAFGAAPRRPPLFGLKEARLNEFGDASSDAVYIEYNDFLAENDNETLRVTAVETLAAQLCADVFVFRNARAPLAAALRTFANAKGWRAVTLNEQPVYAVDLAAIRNSGGDVMGSLQGSLRAQTQRALRRYEERGVVSVRAVKASGDWTDAWRTMTALHEARWKPGVFANDRLVAFHDRLRRAAPTACELLHVCAGDETIGALYNFAFADRVMNYQSGFFFEDDNQLKPGYVCHALACQHYLERGFDVYDMLAGEAAYKRRLGAPVETLTSIALERPGLRNNVINILRSFRRKPESD